MAALELPHTATKWAPIVEYLSTHGGPAPILVETTAGKLKASVKLFTVLRFCYRSQKAV